MALFEGKREFLAGGLYITRIISLLGQMPARDSLLVLNYHRIGDPRNDPFDPGVFSATAEQFSEQVSYLKRYASIVTLEEALAFVDGTASDRTPRCRVLLSFDDGYLDNYEVAFPILVRMECLEFSSSPPVWLVLAACLGGITSLFF